ncbi:MAG: hypothetical protein PHF95_06785, partial [bacterium]|nr:hypothetical protein [bacterium]
MKNKVFFLGSVMLIFTFTGRIGAAAGIDASLNKAKKEVQENNKNLAEIKNKIKEKSVYSEKLKGQEIDITAELRRSNRELAKI